MKKLKRVLALVTVLSMLMSVSAFAADGDGEGEAETVEVTIVVTPPDGETPPEQSEPVEESDEPETVMDIVEDIHDAIDNAADGSTVTITVGENGEGTLVNDGEGVLEASITTPKGEETLNQTLATAKAFSGESFDSVYQTYLAQEAETFYQAAVTAMGSEEAVLSAMRISSKNDYLKAYEAGMKTSIQSALDRKAPFVGEGYEALLANYRASGDLDYYKVGQNILEVPDAGTVTVDVNGTIESNKKWNNTISAPVVKEKIDNNWVWGGRDGTLVVEKGSYSSKNDAYTINLPSGTVKIDGGDFSGAIRVTGELELDEKTLIPGGSLFIEGGTFSNYAIYIDGAGVIAQKMTDSNSFNGKTITGKSGTVQISGGSFDSVATLKDGFLTDGIVLVENLNSDNMYTAVARSSLVDTYDLTAHETEGQATYYTITLKVVNEETGEEEIIEAPVYFYDDSSDDSSDDDTPAAPVTQTIEEEATPLAALPEAFTADDVASLAVDLGLAESVESYDFVAETTAETVSSVIESLTAGNENADAAAILADAGITPESVVSREQFATVIYALAGTAGFDTTARADLAEKFTDADAVSAFAQEALEWAVEAGIYRGTSQTTLDPKSTLTYDQLILVVSRYLAMLNAQ